MTAVYPPRSGYESGYARPRGPDDTGAPGRRPGDEEAVGDVDGAEEKVGHLLRPGGPAPEHDDALPYSSGSVPVLIQSGTVEMARSASGSFSSQQVWIVRRCLS